MLGVVTESSFGLILGVIDLLLLFGFLLSTASLLGRLGPFLISTPLLVTKWRGTFLFAVICQILKWMLSRICSVLFLHIKFGPLLMTTLFGGLTPLVCFQLSLSTLGTLCPFELLLLIPRFSPPKLLRGPLASFRRPGWRKS